MGRGSFQHGQQASSMTTTIEIKVPIYPTKGVSVEFDEILEVSLDCFECHRALRTVVIDPKISATALCTPTCHSYPAHLESVEARVKKKLLRKEVQGVFRLSYEYREVRDRKYPHRVSSRLPSWARVRFKAKCPRCGTVTQCSAQNNIVRPWTCLCRCGNELYTERKPIPEFCEVMA